MTTLKISVKKGEVVRQLLNTSTGIAYIRTATMQPNSPISSINAPAGYIAFSYTAEHDTELVLQASDSVMDLDNNPYAPLLEV